MANNESKTTKNARRWQRTSLGYLQKFLTDLENNLAISLEKLVLKKSSNNEVFEHIKNTFEMEMENEIFKLNKADQVKGNATKLQYTNYSKNINGSPSFISDLESNYS